MPELKTDKIFQVPGHVQPFEFNADVAEVFDDMAQRSIPFYLPVQKQMLALIESLNPNFKKLVDLGCSTGSFIFALAEQMNSPDKFYVGLDLSQNMIEQSQKKLTQLNLAGQFDWQCASMLDCDFHDMDVVILNYTLQFIDPEERLQLLTKMQTQLKKGCLVFVSEKLKMQQPEFQKSFTEVYEQFKRGNKYSNLEIAQKRKALENVLVPFTEQENLALFEKAGFTKVDCFFRWFNFASFVLIKE